jgi:pimeloyl-ACP methyl ester carboxylesterase
MSGGGSGPPLIVIQQLDPPAFWAETIDALTEACEVIAVDLPGFGESPLLPDERPPSVPALAGAVATWIAGAGLDRPYVVGNSLGGAVAIELAKRKAVAGAVAISPVGFWTRREASRALRSLRAGRAVARVVVSRPGLITGTGLGRTLAFGQLVARPRTMPEATARSALVGLATASGLKVGWREVLGYRLEGPEPEVPVTIAWAAKDRMTPPRQARRAEQLLP